MKVVLLAREGSPGRWMAAALAKRHDIRVIFESGAMARRRKLRRYFKSSAPWTWPWQAANILAALWYNRRVGRAVDRFCAAHRDASVEYEHVSCEDANDHLAHARLREWAPDLVLVYGTAILRDQTLSLAPCFINIHGGLVPQYRNVHCEFWALARGEPELVGTSALYVDRGIDTGDVFLQRAVARSPNLTVRDAVCANHRLAVEVALDVVEMSAAGRMPRARQDSSILTRSSRTPGVADVLRAVVFRRPEF